MSDINKNRALSALFLSSLLDRLQALLNRRGKPEPAVFLSHSILRYFLRRQTIE